MPYLNRSQLPDLGLASCGDDVLISDRCTIYGAASIHIGSHVRIDDFSIITADKPVVLGSHVHIGPHVFISGQHGVRIGDFVTVSVGSSILTSNDDFSGDVLTGPTVPDDLRNPTNAEVVLGRHSVVTAHTVVLPGVTIGEGTVVGSNSLVREPLPPWSIYAGTPARFLKPRNRNLLELEKHLVASPRGQVD